MRGLGAFEYNPSFLWKKHVEETAVRNVEYIRRIGGAILFGLLVFAILVLGFDAIERVLTPGVVYVILLSATAGLAYILHQRGVALGLHLLGLATLLAIPLVITAHAAYWLATTCAMLVVTAGRSLDTWVHVNEVPRLFGLLLLVVGFGCQLVGANGS